MRIPRAGSLTLLFAGFAALGRAQQPGANPAAPDWGTASDTAITLNAFAFQPLDAGAVATYNVQGSRWLSAGGTIFVGSLSLPTGAAFQSIEIDGCDESSTGRIEAILFRSAKASESISSFGFVSSGDAAAPGCGSFLNVFLSVALGLHWPN